MYILTNTVPPPVSIMKLAGKWPFFQAEYYEELGLFFRFPLLQPLPLQGVPASNEWVCPRQGPMVLK
jgi:hypothetical protein